MKQRDHPPGPGSLARRVPAASWLPRYQRGWLASDAIAGFTIWGLLVPEMIAYASLAGLPPQAGLYTLLASLALYAIFGTSRHLVAAGTSASAVLACGGSLSQSAANDGAGARTEMSPVIAAALSLVTVENAVVSSAEPVRAAVLVMDGNDNLDITSAEQLGKLAGGLAARNVPLSLTHVHGPVLEMAERSGLLASVGADHVFPTTPAAVAWAQPVAGTPAPG